MNKFLLVLTAFCSFFAGNAYAQQQADSIPPPGSEIIQKGIELFDVGKYDESINLFSTVSPCDPDYALACYETALALSNQGKNEQALEKCEESLMLNPGNVQFCILKGNLLDNLGQTEEAIKWLQHYQSSYPYNQNLLYNLALCHLNNDEVIKAEALLLRGLYYNPFHASSHLALARINYIMGRKAQSYLAYNVGILMNPRVEYIKEYEEAISDKIDSVSKSYLYSDDRNAGHAKWKDLTGLLNAEVAFREDFRYEYPINFISCRQSSLLFQKMNFDEKDTTLYNQFYVRFLKKMIETDGFETYIYYMLRNFNIEAVAEWTKKNEARIDSFIAHARNTINTWKAYGFSTENEASRLKRYHFNSNGVLENLGVLREQPEPSKEGTWYVISSTGAISQEGAYKNNLEEGRFLIFWPDVTTVKQKLNFKNGKLDGINYTYHRNGSREGIYPRENGIPVDKEEEYNSAGRLTSCNSYRNGRIEGNSVLIDYAGGFRRETPFVHGKRQGIMSEKWLNGSKKAEATYADSLLQGSYKKWYANSRPEWEGNYEKDVQTGKWISWHPNGIKSAEGTCDQKGELTGLYCEFDRHGRTSLQVSGYKNGQPDGTQTYFYPDGSIQAKLMVQEGKITHIDCFDSAGKKIYSAQEENGRLDYKFFFPEGTVKTEGTYVNGLRDGTWKTYNITGKTVLEENWSAGLRSGVQNSFHSNGQLHLTYSSDSNNISGKVIRYFRNGHLAMTGYYNREGATGEWTSFHNNDSVQSRFYFVHDRLAGRRMNYSPEGKLSSEEIYNEDGEAVRIKFFDHMEKLTDDLDFQYDSVSFERKYPDGKIKHRLTMIDHRKNGPEEFYFPNGQLKDRQLYCYGNAQGEKLEWDYFGKPVYKNNYCMNEPDGNRTIYENGAIGSTDSCEIGTDQGFYREYHPNGRIFRMIMTENGERQGKADFFAPDSTWMYSFLYRDDEICSVSYRDKLGNLHADERISMATSEIVTYFENGKISARLPFSKGIYSGKYITYYSNGQALRELNYLNDYLEGVSRYYYENGILKASESWRNGSKTGPYQSFYPNGSKESEGQYLSGLKTGKWLFYDKAGKITQTLHYANDEIYQPE